MKKKLVFVKKFISMFSITLQKRKVLKKILIIRFSSIGDIILTTPVIRALKTQINCRLHILTKEKFSVLFATSPYVDQIHTFCDKLEEIIPDLRAENFDFVVDLHKNLRSFRIKRALKVPSASFSKANPEKWLMVNLKIDRLPKEHIVDRYFQAVQSFGIKNDRKGLDYFIPEKDFIDLNEYPLLKKKPFIAFSIGGRHHTKLFPVQKVVAVIDRLQQPVVLLGGNEDRETAEQIKELCSHDGIMNACGQLNLHQSASLIRQSALVITNDTGLMHIAAAFKKPVISIWGNTIPEFGMYPYEPDEEQKVVIAQVKDLKCRPCGKIGFKKCPKGHFKCMMNQDEDFIVGEANRLLSL
jgi:ADP-heptose:LPS heptosyltransferase